ncbi:MAG TPA: sugar nucleotide-binding protein, partial [Pseudoxanthomonas sp.]|nr:sugar nucleotide-binding protein [Pseudoxanthomonas sp.]
PDLADAVLTLLVDGAQGLWHLANPGAVSWHALAVRAAEAAGLSPAGLRARPAAALGLRAARPPYSVLGSARGGLMPPLDHALARFIDATAADRADARDRGPLAGSRFG